MDTRLTAQTPWQGSDVVGVGGAGTPVEAARIWLLVSWATAVLAGLALVLGVPAVLVLAALGAALAVAMFLLGPTRATGPLVFAVIVVPDHPLAAGTLSTRMLLLVVVAALAGGWLLDGRLGAARLPAAAGWAALALVVVVGGVANSRPTSVLTFALALLLPCALGATLGHDPAVRRSVARWLAAATLLVAAAAVVEFASQEPLLPTAGRDLDALTRLGQLRASVGFGHPLALGLFLSLATFPTVAFWGRHGGRAIASMVLCAAAIFCTLSRSPLVGLAIGCAVFALVQTSGRARLRIALTAAAAAAVLVWFPGTHAQEFRAYLDRSTDPRAEEAGNVFGRVNLLQTGIDAVAAKPLVGYGFGATLGGQADFLQLGARSYTDVANFPLAVALETGLAGLLALTGILVSVLWNMLRSGDPYHGAVAGGIIAALVTSVGVTAIGAIQILLLLLGVYGTGGRDTDAAAS